MKKIFQIIASAIMALALFGAAGNAGTVNFNFKIPAIPWPPLVSEVVNSALIEGAANFTVTSKIAAQMQQTPTCDKTNQADCVSTDWYLKPSPGVSPNPPDIKTAKVYYYLNDQAASAASVNMALDASLGENKWKATVPIPAGAKIGDNVTYYIVAVDSRGNVASQVPDTGSVNSACPSSPSSWNQEFSTPATNSCAQATSYTQCNVYVAGSPTCGTAYTLNDKTGDVCGEPDGNGNQSIVNVPKTDITGITAAADKDYLCMNFGLGAAPPDANDPSPIEGYLAIIFNPDKYDDNPADFQIKNAYAITYAPEVTATDPTLVRVLWDANCITDPNTANILDCKLIYVTGTDTKLQIGYSGGLKYIVKRSGTGNPLAVPYSLVGDTQKLSYLVGLTGEINLSGANAFWIADLTAGLSFYQKNQVVPITPPCTDCWTNLDVLAKCGDGVRGKASVCPKSATNPQQNKCALSWTEPSDTSLITNYKIYRSTNSSFVAGVTPLFATVPKTTLIFTDTIANLDGTTYYYFVSQYNANSSDPSMKDPPPTVINANVASCKVEDWTAPGKPFIVKAMTPTGNEKKCKLDFTTPSSDPTLKSFYFTRDGVLAGQMNAEPLATSFSWTDPTALAINTSYSYTTTAIDMDGNTNTSDPVTCKPEDFKAPAAITTAMGSNVSGKLGIHLDWTASTETDLAGYYAYWCKMSNSAIDCRASSSFAKMSAGMISKEATSYENSDPAIFTSEADYCFYLDPCDNCDTAGNCPSNAGKPNCSGYPSGGADAKMNVKCLKISVEPSPSPAFPSGVAISAPPEGRKCKLTWNNNFQNSDGTPFKGVQPIISPAPEDLTGYKIMRNTVTGVPSPAQADPVGVVSLGGASGNEFTDTTVVNGQTYYYTVYSVDATFGNFSSTGAGGTATEAKCIPEDKIPPSIPVMTTPDYTQISCTPKWAAVTDEDPITYDIYKCEGGATVCNAANKFTADADCVMEGDGVSCTDTSLATDKEYTFCVTASDLKPNTSPVFPSTGRTNCAACTPSARPKPITGATAEATSDKKSARMYWTNSTDYDQNSNSSGVNIYRCADATCASKTKIKSCSDLKANSDAVKNIGFANQVQLTGELAGTWYYGITYQTDCTDANTESFLIGASIGGPVEIIDDDLCIKYPATCVTISSCDDGDCSVCATTPSKCAPLKELDASSYVDGGGVILEKQPGRFSGKSGASIYLLTEQGAAVNLGTTPTTDPNGNFKISIDNREGKISSTEKYQVVIKLNAADKAGIPCSVPSIFGTFKDSLGQDCAMLVQRGVKLANGTKTKVTLPTIPKAGQGRSEIGNINCDNTVDMKDFTFIKKNFNKTAATGMSKFADINQDGVVNMQDFTVLKKNFGKCIGGSFDAGTGACSAAGAPTKITDLCSQ